MGLFDNASFEEVAKKHYEIFGHCYLCGTWLESHPPENCPEELRLCCYCNDIISLIVCEVVDVKELLAGNFEDIFGPLEEVKVKQVVNYILDINEKANNILHKGGVVVGLHR